MRVGFGYDAHPLVVGRKLILGGVEISYHLGLQGHSDGDVLTHALTDALLGAAGLGDIGKHFPSADPTYKDISSQIILEAIMEKVRHQGWRLSNADATVVLERPTLAPHLSAMQQRLAATLGVDAARLNLKATTTDGLGFPGRGEGVAAYAIVLLEETGP